MSSKFREIEEAKEKIKKSTLYSEKPINEVFVSHLAEILVKVFGNSVIIDDEDDQKIIKFLLGILFFLNYLLLNKN